MTSAQKVLNYWLADAALSIEHARLQKKLWYRSSAEIDAEIKKEFSLLHEQAKRGELDSWRQTSESSLALVILLDQFTRHLYRGTAQAFSCDALALDIARHCPAPSSLPFIGQAFLLHPYEHSEQKEVQSESIALFESLAEKADEEFQPMMLEFHRHAKEHCDIVTRFGRFPHRNKVLGRDSTEEELEFLAQSGKSFGQKPKT